MLHRMETVDYAETVISNSMLETLPNIAGNTAVENTEEHIATEVGPKLEFRRWLILTAYCLLSISNLSTWFSSSSISNILQKFYGKDLVAINWIAQTYSLVTLFLMFPFAHLMHKKGLSSLMVAAAFFNSLGSCIKYIGSSSDQYGYWFHLGGNLFCGTAGSAFIFLPPKIAALWFGEKERATATSIAIAADSLGLAIGYIQPPSMVAHSQFVDKISADLSKYLLTVTVQSVVTFIFICIVIRDRPNTPPSASEASKVATQDSAEMVEYSRNVSLTRNYKVLFKNCHYQVILHVHGILFATETIWLVVLNEILIPRFPGHEVAIGSMGSVGLILSMFSNFLTGVVVDRTRAYRRITLIVTCTSFVLVGCFSASFHLTNNFICFYIIYIFITATFTTYYTIAFDHGAEMTYPVSEAHSGVLLLWFAQLYSLIFAQAASLIVFHLSSIWLVYFMLGLYLFACLLSFRVKNRGPRTKHAISYLICTNDMDDAIDLTTIRSH